MALSQCLTKMRRTKMGNFKETQREGLRETSERSQMKIEEGSGQVGEATEVRAILEGITLQDSEDMEAIENTEDSYQTSFDNAFTENIETVAEEIEEQSEMLKTETNTELENVDASIGQLEQAGAVTEVGREVAETGQVQLEKSAQEYEGISTEAENVKNETEQQIESLKDRLGEVFG